MYLLLEVHLQSFGSPFVFTQGSIVTLEAEVEDPDGFVEEVRFYGNGQLLGNNPLGGIESLTILNFGNPRAFSAPPVYFLCWRRGWSRC